VTCWICYRQARGFGYLDRRYPAADPRRYPLAWVFCSRRCQDAFHTRYRVQIEGYQRDQGVTMRSPTEIERTARRLCLKAFGQVAQTIGFEKPLGSYSEADALQVIEAIVTCFTETMTAHHEATQHPAIWGMKPTVDDPFADLQDDLPWEPTP